MPETRLSSDEHSFVGQPSEVVSTEEFGAPSVGGLPDNTCPAVRDSSNRLLAGYRQVLGVKSTYVDIALDTFRLVVRQC